MCRTYVKSYGIVLTMFVVTIAVSLSREITWPR